MQNRRQVGLAKVIQIYGRIYETWSDSAECMFPVFACCDDETWGFGAGSLESRMRL